MPRPVPTKTTLVRRLVALEVVPFVGALMYSYFHPRMALVALSVYAVCALMNGFLSIRDGAVLGYASIVEQRTTKGDWFWYWVFRTGWLPLLIFCVAIAAAINGTLVR
jgi:hypothetical protein